jgi:uncharacterized delta-60 repeat protein
MFGLRQGNVVVAILGIAGVVAASAAAHPTGGDSDAGFGSGTPSAARETCGSGGAGAFDAARQADGELVLAGESGDAEFANFCIIRLEEDGRRDPGFGDGSSDTEYSGDGETEIGFGSAEGARAVAIQPDGRAVVAGYVREGSGEHLALTRLDTDGTLDTTFGDGGRRVVADAAGAVDVFVQADGRIVAIAAAGGGMGAVRLTADGSLDTSYGGGDGIAAVPPPDRLRAQETLAGALQADGKVVIAGRLFGVGPQSSAVAGRLNADGSVDTSFGDAGRVFVGVGDDPVVEAVIPGAGGAVTLVGSARVRQGGVPTDLFLARFTAAGARDRSFAPSGVRKHDLPGTPLLDAAAPAGDGGLTVAGGYAGSARLRSSFFVAKTLRNGMLDRNFARRTVTFGAPVEAGARAVVPTAGGRVLLAGPASTPFTAVQLTGPRARALACRGGLSGTGLDDRLVGTSSGDAIDGEGGADRISGLGGGDCLTGGTGADVISAGAGRNVIRGGSGNDRISARNGARDVVNCGTGRDRATVDRVDRVTACEVVSRG